MMPHPLSHNGQGETVKFLKENIKVTLPNLGFDNGFSYRTPKARAMSNKRKN